MLSSDYETESSRESIPPNDWHHGEEDLATLSQQTSSGQSAQELPHAHAAQDAPPHPPPVGAGEPSIGAGPGGDSDYSEEFEEPEHYNPAPVRGLGLVAGNGPVPRERGNIGDSIGTAPEPPNGA